MGYGNILVNDIVVSVKSLKTGVIRVLAVKGIYNNGKVILEDNPLIEMSEVVVVFPDNELESMPMESNSDGKRALFEEFSGSINRIIDLKAERLEALDERL